MDKFRVMHMVLSLQTGGLEKLVVDLARGLNSRCDVEAAICCLDSEDTPLKRKAGEHKILVFNLPVKGGLRKLSSLLPLSKLVSNEKIDILHTHNATAHVQGAILSCVTGKPLVHTKHGNMLPFAEGKKWSRHLWAAKKTKKVIAVSCIVQETVIRAYRLPEDRVAVIFNGINLGRSPGSQRDSSQGPVIGAVGRLSREKDYSTLLKAFKKVKEAIPQARLNIVGDGAEKNALMEESRKLQLENAVTFLGMRDDVPELLAGFDIFVQPSLTEGISLTILEAMGACLPVVVTDVGGNPEIVEDGRSGYLVPASKSDQMAETIIKVLNNPPLAQTLGNAGRKRVEEKFSLDRMVDDYVKVYREVMNRK